MKVLLAVFTCTLLGAACSSGGEGSGGSTGSPVPAAAGGEAPPASGVSGADGPPASGVDAAAVRSPEAFAEYYRKLGVAEPVIACYVDALAELDVASLDQLEADQELGARAADRFDGCVASVGAGDQTETSTT